LNESAIQAELAKTLALLGIKQINTYFYHSFKEYESGTHLMQKLLECKKKGLIRKIGVSIYTNDELLTVINDPDVDVIQLPFNLLDNYSQRGSLLKEAKQKGKGLQARSVFLQGLFFKDLDNLPAQLMPLKPYLQDVKDLAKKNSLTMESLCLQYVSAQKEIDEIIIGVDNKEQLIHNLNSVNTKLSAELCEHINSIKVSENSLLYPYNWVRA
ncbi:MAG: uncharacterized protein JWQ30_1783, partial [Sediminibacterium sp.]|nr:uncharacterized protein [Sediminibacterium sp.]